MKATSYGQYRQFKGEKKVKKQKEPKLSDLLAPLMLPPGSYRRYIQQEQAKLKKGS